MPESIPDFVSHVANLEAKLGALQRHIIGTAAVGNAAIPRLDENFSFQARYETALEEWSQFQGIWDELRMTKFAMGEEFPNASWQGIYDVLRKEILDSRAINIRIEALRRASQHVSQDRPSLNCSSLNSSVRANLPKIPIPQFSGDMTKWSHFKDTFVSLVHHEPSLSKVEKFHYLLGALKGEASSLLARFPVEERSYDQAWDKLISTYENPRILASLLINKMIDCNISSAKSEEQRYEFFLTTVADSIDAFKALRLEDPLECLLSNLALRSLDSGTRRQFELSLRSTTTFPTSDQVVEFVRQRKLAIKMSQNVPSLNSSASKSPQGVSHSTTSSPRFPNRTSPRFNKSVSLYTAMPKDSRSLSPKSSLAENKPPVSCPKCKRPHNLYNCEDFLRLSSEQRSDFVRSSKLCFNCLCKGHSIRDCRSQFRCRTCHKRHHTLIHRDQNNVAKDNPPQDPPKPQPQDVAVAFSGFGSAPPSKGSSTVLLGTLRALIRGQRGDYHSVRAVLDSGSQHSFITHSLASKLGADITPFCGSISSLGEATVPQTQLKGLTSCLIRPYEGDRKFTLETVVVDRITSALPRRDLPKHVVDSLACHQLADHQFGISRPVDLLIGGDLFPYLIEGAPIDSGTKDLVLLPTPFGLVVSGSLQSVSLNSSCTFFLESSSLIESQLKAFWEMEEPIPVDRVDPDDKFCEDHFVLSHTRTPDGRYVVRFPFKQNPVPLGENRAVATRRFTSLEQRLKKSPQFAQCYSSFMSEYISLGHMSPAPGPSSYLIPHHGVWQNGPHAPKLRVVFDASCPSSSKSLNDLLLPGPKLQADLCSILIRFRLYLIPLCTDLVKMYRQVLIHPDDRCYQHVLWRANPSEALQEFELNTVTYGIKSSAFHALRVIRQLVEDEGSNHPLAACRVLSDMYVDDFTGGADSAEEAIELQRQLVALFAKGGFTLSKWASTIPELIPPSMSSVDSVSLSPCENNSMKILGLVWNPSSDSFSYTARPLRIDHPTKRTMLSAIARIFDPLGLLAPVIFVAKSLIQDIWKAGVGWDDDLPAQLSASWKELTADWEALSQITVPRYISVSQPSFQLIGFCDASCKGYAASLYLRTENPNGEVSVALIKAKTKVAPLKFVSISRLELCGALLLCRLISSVPEQLSPGTICFTDSRVVLAWLSTPTHALKTFEANRVSQITSIIPPYLWQHVSSEDNPADLASRGCGPRKLKEESSWWSGPSWLNSPISDWFVPLPETVAMPAFHPTVSVNDEPWDWTLRFSSFRGLVRTTSRMLRLFQKRPHSEHISSDEFKEAELRCIKFVQGLYFPKELYNSSSIPKCYASLSPFLDERGVLRVGGRLQEAPLSYSSRHPILIPSKSSLARLIIRDIHDRHFHAGPSLTLALLRNKFWIPRAAKMIKSCIVKCVGCRLLKAKPIAPIMANIPKERFSQVRAFLQTGVDYAGPLLIKESTRRNAKFSKAYICLFVCFSTKAIHLELVTSLSTAVFLDALERFISRRGTPNVIWSDHGSNFVGASRFLKEVFRFHKKVEPAIVDSLAPRGVDWKFIPPRAPHFGGLWEAGVKSVKGLLSHSIGKQPYTFEELVTVLAKIEAILNSRPLCPLTEDAQNFNFLTPGHFLVGASHCSLPQPIPSSNLGNSLSSRWLSLQNHIAHIWKRWRREYLHSLLQRGKWQRPTPELQIGDLVILIERRSSPGQWPVARVVKTFPGRDGVTRTVEIRIPSGNTFMRAVTSLVPLFASDAEDCTEAK